ncbi:hypothetical protein BDN71DRAFT_1510413 [Pleurotus eryngii]|uniref:Uncharacterized protein n=1 Tax=Pleurotus eryngii TaxID=5323 RepID=A0A9P5ZRK3_PLEER|nr:hypothetical protein BDN71DRAFT_1510413 [Pleurotus eryngii]
MYGPPASDGRLLSFGEHIDSICVTEQSLILGQTLDLSDQLGGDTSTLGLPSDVNHHIWSLSRVLLLRHRVLSMLSYTLYAAVLTLMFLNQYCSSEYMCRPVDGSNKNARVRLRQDKSV